MNKKIISTLTGILFFVGIAIMHKQQMPTDGAFTIGIIQTASHPALDQVRENFMTEFKQLSKKEVTFVVQNAEGSSSQAQCIAENFHSHSRIQAIVAIGTLAVQSIKRIEKKKPIIIAAVSNPSSLNVQYKGTNVCGTTDRIDAQAQIAMVCDFFPRVKSVAILFNPMESNSEACVREEEKELDAKKIAHSLFAAHCESEVLQVIATATAKHDLILIPTDNLMASCMPLIAKEALKRKCPLIVSDIHLVSKGALLAEGANYANLGKDTAHIAIDVLIHKKSPEEIGIHDPKETTIVVNRRFAETIGLDFPKKGNLIPTAVETQIAP